MKETHVGGYKVSLVRSTNKNYEEVLVTYPYKNKTKKRFLFIRKKDGATSEYYLTEAKKIIKNGDLNKYTRKPFKKFLPWIIVGASVLTAGAVAVSGYLAYRILTTPIIDIQYQGTSAKSAEVIAHLKTKPYKTNLQEVGFANYLNDMRNRQDDYIEKNIQTATEAVIENAEKEHREAEAAVILDAFTRYEKEDGVFKDNPMYYFKTDNYERVIFYLHGGAYFKSMTYQHIVTCYQLSQKFNAKVYMPLYPVAPQHDFNDCFYYINNVYDEISTLGADTNKDIIVAGDSAGAGLALGFTQYLYKYKKDTAKLPIGRILYSPWCDVTMSNPEIMFKEDQDIFLAPYGLREIGKIWAGTYDRTDYKISPLYGDLNDKIPTIIFQGTDEILLPDTILTATKLSLNGCRTRLVLGKKLFHVYPIFLIGTTLPEATESLDLSYNFIINKK